MQGLVGLSHIHVPLPMRNVFHVRYHSILLALMY
jgi:hypothetical protein